MDFDHTPGKRLKSKKVHTMELIAQDILDVSMFHSFLESLLAAAKGKKGKMISELLIKFMPYFGDRHGSMLFNMYDRRKDNPQERLLLHTAFPSNADQYLCISPNMAIGPEEKNDPLGFDLVPKRVDAKSGSNYAYVKAWVKFRTSKDRFTGTSPTIMAFPSLKYVRGIDLDANVIMRLTRSHEFSSETLASGADYVLQGANIPSAKLSGKVFNCKDLDMKMDKDKLRETAEGDIEVVTIGR